jgi:hypothetical protein
VQRTLLGKSQLHSLSFTRKSKKNCKSDEDYKKRIEKENSFRHQNKNNNFHPQNKTTMSEDSSAKLIKLKTTIQPLRAIFHLKINTTVSTMKGHSKNVAST